MSLLRRKASATRPFLIAFLRLTLTNAMGICPHHGSLAFIAPSLRHRAILAESRYTDTASGDVKNIE